MIIRHSGRNGVITAMTGISTVVGDLEGWNNSRSLGDRLGSGVGCEVLNVVSSILQARALAISALAGPSHVVTILCPEVDVVKGDVVARHFVSTFNADGRTRVVGVESIPVLDMNQCLLSSRYVCDAEKHTLNVKLLICTPSPESSSRDSQFSFTASTYAPP